MFDIIRESSFGERINWISGGRLLPYAEQRSDFIVPAQYLLSTTPASAPDDSEEPTRANSIEQLDPVTRVNSKDRTLDEKKSEREFDPLPIEPRELEAGELKKAGEERDLNPVEEVEISEHIIVDWYGPDDPANPRNWSSGKRHFVLGIICVLTFSIYMGSAIYTASIPYLLEEFHISLVVATLGLTLYVLAYGIGPMLFSPLQELPSWGRNPVYIFTAFIFVVLQVPTALAKNIAGLLVLRFLGGFFASPALATGGASVGDIYQPQHLPYALSLWAFGAVCGPVAGPIVGSFAAASRGFIGGWRIPIWELMWAAGFASLMILFFLPETLPDTILLKRAQRLRKLTGNDKLRSMSEIKQAEMSTSAVMKEYLVRPFQLMLEPAVLFLNIYLGLAYSIFYLWFEAFPIVFDGIYGFKAGIDGLPYIGIIIGTFVALVINAAWNKFYIERLYMKGQPVAPEERLKLALFAGIMIPISLLIFGWTSRHNVHWSGPIIGAGIYMPGIFLLFQCFLIYLPMSYPNYAASVLAGNDFVRSSMASVFPLFGRPFFKHLGVGGGSSLLAGLSALMIPALWLLIRRGPQLRAMSRYATA
ncbi:hypothetical protein FRB94_001186 [Tulasnella sp. JGI-2019a]|nr:hypothetical protein FRB94_001186 [Tulasnella sp. JGI-2019a]